MKKLFKILFKVFTGILGLGILYGLAVILLPLISISEEKTQAPKNIPIYILTNGVHTDLVLPIKTKNTDWGQLIPFENTRSQNTDFNYLAIGWGDKGFYLDTPTWADLKPSTAIKAAFWLGESAIHCTYYKEMQENENCKKIMLTTEQYQNLVNFIQDGFDRDENGNFILIKTDAVYGDNDAFYEAKGSYNFTKTCNTWVNNGLKVAGQKAALWTATDSGIFRHYE